MKSNQKLVRRNLKEKVYTICDGTLRVNRTCLLEFCSDERSQRDSPGKKTTATHHIRIGTKIPPPVSKVEATPLIVSTSDAPVLEVLINIRRK
jgi:hypothetical protein